MNQRPHEIPQHPKTKVRPQAIGETFTPTLFLFGARGERIIIHSVFKIRLLETNDECW